MPKNRRVTAGTRQLNVEVEESLLTRVKEFVSARGETLREFTELAFRRHLDNPPPPAPIPPLPPVVLPAQAKAVEQEPAAKSSKRKAKP